MIDLTQKEIRFLLSALQGLQIKGDRATVRATMELADSIEEKLKQAVEEKPVTTPLPPKPKRSRHHETPSPS